MKSKESIELEKVMKLCMSLMNDRGISYDEFNAIDWGQIEWKGEKRKVIDELYFDIQQWLADSDLRKRDKEYENVKRERIKYWLEQIKISTSA